MRAIRTRLLSRRATNRPSYGKTAQRTGVTIEARSREDGNDQRGCAAEATWVRVQGMVRSDAIHLLPRYGTVYALFDERSAAYDCALKSDVFRLADWVGEYVEVDGPLTDRDGGLPTMTVARLQLLAAKWMR